MTSSLQALWSSSANAGNRIIGSTQRWIVLFAPTVRLSVETDEVLFGRSNLNSVFWIAPSAEVRCITNSQIVERGSVLFVVAWLLSNAGRNDVIVELKLPLIEPKMIRNSSQRTHFEDLSGYTYRQSDQSDIVAYEIWVVILVNKDLLRRNRSRP